MDKQERITQLKQEIREKEKELHKLEKEINAELLPQFVGKYFKSKNDFYYLKVCEYDEELNLLKGWGITIDKDWNKNNLYTAEYLSFMHYHLFDDKTEISEKDFGVALNIYINSIKTSIAKG